MSKRRRKTQKPSAQHLHANQADRAARQGRISERKATRTATKRGGLRAIAPILRAMLVFCLCMGLFYVLESTLLFQETVFPAYLRSNAEVSGAILRCFGEQVAVDDVSVSSPSFALEIRRGCDAVEPSALYIAAVIALPVLIWKRLAGIVVGTALLAAINLVRILSLYYVGMHWPTAFEAMHLDVWQAVFILLVIVFWAVWARWARRAPGAAAHVSI